MKNLIMAILLILSANAMADVSTYDLTLKGKQCKEGLNQQLDCDYKIGNDFHLSIGGVGQSDAGVTFIKSNFNGKYYGTFGILHGCVIVKTGIKNTTKNPFDFAFVSPINGKVYKDWESCKTGQ
jgi:hypothetical protein